MHAKIAASFLDNLKALWQKTDPRVKAMIGAAAGLGVYESVGGPLGEYFFTRTIQDVEEAEGDKIIPIEKDESGAELLKWVKRFKKEHPYVSDVPVYVSGILPTSAYVSELVMGLPGMKDYMGKTLGISNPGIYIREKAAPVALHELGHAALEKKVPLITVLTHGASLSGLVPVAMTIFRKPGKPVGFVHKYAPAIAAALQVPMLAEEAAASIIAEKTLRDWGETGKKMLVPAWITYALASGKFPLMAAGAKLLRKKANAR